MALGPLALVKQLMTILHCDREETLLEIDRYVHGDQRKPYMPDMADAEYRLLAERSITNVMDFIAKTPVQAMYVDSFRPGHTAQPTALGVLGTQADQPEWDHWQRSGMDFKQHAIYTGAVNFGHSFVHTKMDKNGKVISKGLSALKTSAVYEDPANDIDPVAAFHVMKWPTSDQLGIALYWDGNYEYDVNFKSLTDMDSVAILRRRPHGAKECPVTRFAAAVDLEGRTVGVVEPMMPLQDRLNQTIFDLLIVQSFASFKVRTISGMAPPMKMKPVYETIDGQQELTGWEPELDKNGKPIPDAINLNARRFFFAEDSETRFGTMDETPLDGFIKAIEQCFRQIAALSQTPPHHILGEIANLSAEALEAAEISLSRKVSMFKSSFGESWERVFRVAAQIGGFPGADDFAGEVMWRDMEQKSLAQAGDALGKLKDSLGIPARGLWERVPGVTATELSYWEELAKTEDGQKALADALNRSTDSKKPSFRQDPAESEPAAA